MQEPIIRIHGIIGEELNTAAAIGATLAANPGPVLIEINSPGGDAFEGAAIMAAVEAHGAVTAHGVGVVASAASLILMAARRAALHHAAPLMIHEPQNFAWGTAEDLRQVADNLDKFTNLYAGAYTRLTGHPVSRILSWMKAETWLEPEEALALNFIDEILEAPVRGRAVAQYDYGLFRHPPRQLLRVTARQGWAVPKPGEAAA